MITYNKHCPICNCIIDLEYKKNNYCGAYCNDIYFHYTNVLYGNGLMYECSDFEMQHPTIKELDMLVLKSERLGNKIESWFYFKSSFTPMTSKESVIFDFYIPPNLDYIKRILNLKAFI